MVRERKAREELGLDALEVPHVQRRPSSVSPVAVREAAAFG